MPLRRFDSLTSIAAAGLRVRVWCWRCAQGKDMDAADLVQAFTARRWSTAIRRALHRFRCRECGLADQAIILPASPPQVQSVHDNENFDHTWAREVEAFFHANRASKKKGDAEPVKVSTVSLDSRRREGLEWALGEAKRQRLYPPLRLVRVGGRPVR